ncbi:MAG: AraC family transcriptional regulator [Aureispira sp.]
MDNIKTYTAIPSDSASHEFKWASMGQTYQKYQGKADTPHRHAYYTILIIDKAQGEHLVDFKAYILGERQIYFIYPGQVHQLVATALPQGQALTFSCDFLLHNNIPVDFIENLHLFHSYGQQPALELTAQQWEKVQRYLKEIQQVFQEHQPYKMVAIGALLKLFLIYCHQYVFLEETPSSQQATGQILLKRFKELVEQHYKTWHSSAAYAKTLQITSDHLNRSIKSLLGKTPKAYLQERLTIAAKRLLYFSELSNKEIGYELGFSEPANFSAFFKRNTKLSPTQFRNLR